MTITGLQGAASHTEYDWLGLRRIWLATPWQNTTGGGGYGHYSL